MGRGGGGQQNCFFHKGNRKDSSVRMEFARSASTRSHVRRKPEMYDLSRRKMQMSSLVNNFSPATFSVHILCIWTIYYWISLLLTTLLLASLRRTVLSSGVEGGEVSCQWANYCTTDIYCLQQVHGPNFLRKFYQISRKVLG
jgi:hypothetical protein